MGTQYIVKSGDTLSLIAKKHGISDWRTIYNHPSNAAFRTKRPNPDKIFPGDVILIPFASPHGQQLPGAFSGSPLSTGHALTIPVSPPASSPTIGPSSPIRRRFMSICQSLLPADGTLTAGEKGKVGTGCGELPGRVFGRVPVIHPSQKGAFKVMVPREGPLYLTSPMTVWEQFAQAVDKQYAPARTWVPWAQNSAIRPLPGDIYVLHKYENPAKFQHVGIIVNAEGSKWKTADGGQGNGWQSGFVTRYFYATGQIDGEFGNKAMLRGWVNLDALFAVAITAFPTNL